MSKSWKVQELYTNCFDVPADSVRVFVLRVGNDDADLVCLVNAAKGSDGSVSVDMAMVGTGDLSAIGTGQGEKGSLGFAPDTHVEHAPEEGEDEFKSNSKRRH